MNKIFQFDNYGLSWSTCKWWLLIRFTLGKVPTKIIPLKLNRHKIKRLLSKWLPSSRILALVALVWNSPWAKPNILEYCSQIVVRPTVSKLLGHFTFSSSSQCWHTRFSELTVINIIGRERRRGRRKRIVPSGHVRLLLSDTVTLWPLKV